VGRVPRPADEQAPRQRRDRCLGRTVHASCRIYISTDQDEQAREDTLLHELLHAALFVSGAQAIYGRADSTEEKAVTALTPCLHRLLKDLGFRFPKGIT
jgi:hypothetical protein